MRKIAILTLILAAAIGVKAENTVQLLPQTIEKGSTSDDARCFSIALNNDTPVTAFQFDIYLPEGMAFDDYDPIEFSKTRFPYTVDRRGNITWQHSYMLNHNEAGGFYRVIIYSEQLSKLNGDSGDALDIYYVTDANIPDGVLPVQIKNMQLAFSGTEGVVPDDCSSFFICGDMQADVVSKLDLSGLTGKMTADVVAATNEMIADNTNLTEVRLEGIDDMGDVLTVANPNCMVFMAEDSNALAMGVSGGNTVAVGTGGCSAVEINLVDAKPFGVSTDIAAGTVNYNRNFTTDAWQALYVPYAMSFEQWSELGSVAQFKDVRSDADGDELVWSLVTEGNLEPNTPYIFKPNATGNTVFSTTGCTINSNEGSTIGATSATGVNYTMQGIYNKKTDMCSTNSYALYEGCFRPAANDGVVLAPFRIFLAISSGHSPSNVRNVIDGTNGIEEIDVDLEDDIYHDLIGRKVMNPNKGFYIKNNRVILK